MTINPTEISDIIKAKIKEYDIKSTDHNEGTLVSVSDGIAIVYGITELQLIKNWDMKQLKTQCIDLNLEY